MSRLPADGPRAPGGIFRIFASTTLLTNKPKKQMKTKKLYEQPTTYVVLVRPSMILCASAEESADATVGATMDYEWGEETW